MEKTDQNQETFAYKEILKKFGKAMLWLAHLLVKVILAILAFLAIAPVFLFRYIKRLIITAISCYVICGIVETTYKTEAVRGVLNSTWFSWLLMAICFLLPLYITVSEFQE